MDIDWNSVLLWVLAGILIVVGVLVFWVARRNQRMAGQHVFRASRWSRGNHLFPAQVSVSPTDVVQYMPHWLGKREHTIHMAHIASVDIDTNLFFSNVIIETDRKSG